MLGTLSSFAAPPMPTSRSGWQALLRPQTLLNEIKTNTEIIEALEKGSLYATVL